MTETVQINLNFDNTFRTWMGVAAAAAILAAAVLATIMLNVGWASTAEWSGSQGMEAAYTLTGVEIASTELAYDEVGKGAGQGLITSAYILAIIGLALGFLAIPTLMAGTLMEGSTLRLLGAGAAGLAAVCLVLTAVLGPIGIRQAHDEAFGAAGGGFAWSSGFVLAITAAALALGATASAVLSLRAPRD